MFKENFAIALFTPAASSRVAAVELVRERRDEFYAELLLGEAKGLRSKYLRARREHLVHSRLAFTAVVQQVLQCELNPQQRFVMFVELVHDSSRVRLLGYEAATGDPAFAFGVVST
jgi:hypothetical protein